MDKILKPETHLYYTQIPQANQVALYCRVSTDEQAKFGEGCQDQLQALRRYAAKNNLYVVGEYIDEGFSARKSYKTRPALQRLLKSVESGDTTLILFTRLDRWFRNIGDYYRVQEVLDRHGCRWQAINEDYETVSTSGKFKVSIMLAVAEHEANQTSDRMKFTVEEKRRRGEYIGGTPPIGYKLCDKRIVKDEAKEAAVMAMFATYLTTKSLHEAQVAYEANGLHVQAKTIRRALRRCSETHTGTANGMAVEPYLTLDQAQEIEEAMRPREGRLPREEFIFSGLLLCGECGRRISGHNGHIRKTISKRYVYYNCQNRYSIVPPICSNGVNMNEDIIEAFLLESVEEAFNAYRYNASQKRNALPRRNVEERKRRIEAKKAKLLDAYLDGVIDKDIYRIKSEQLEKELAQVPKEPEPKRIPQALPPDWKTIYTQLTPQNKRAFWSAIIQSISIFPDRHMEISFAP